MQALRDALDALRDASLTEAPSRKPKTLKRDRDTTYGLERASAAPTLDWSRKALVDLSPHERASFRIAFDVLIGARRGYLRTPEDRFSCAG